MHFFTREDKISVFNSKLSGSEIFIYAHACCAWLTKRRRVYKYIYIIYILTRPIFYSGFFFVYIQKNLAILPASAIIKMKSSLKNYVKLYYFLSTKKFS